MPRPSYSAASQYAKLRDLAFVFGVSRNCPQKVPSYNSPQNSPICGLPTTAFNDWRMAGTEGAPVTPRFTYRRTLAPSLLTTASIISASSGNRLTTRHFPTSISTSRRPARYCESMESMLRKSEWPTALDGVRFGTSRTDGVLAADDSPVTLLSGTVCGALLGVGEEASGSTTTSFPCTRFARRHTTSPPCGSSHTTVHP
mmetsp:Transcript_4978/g.12170  ORF Transcript_4978/g.12170 Transcript_4978/m.12170 type:complete len:200 (-) Transcript_4978:1254-1853(-)